MPKTKKSKMRVTFSHCPMDHCPVWVAQAREMCVHLVCKHRVPPVMAKKFANFRAIGAILGIAKESMGWIPYHRYYS